MNLVDIKRPVDQSVEESINHFLERKDSFECVMLVGVNKDGSQYAVTSNCDAYKKAFMVQFAMAMMQNWFKTIESTPREPS